MATDRLLDIFSLMAERGVDDAGTHSLCSVAAEITQLDGAAISLTSEASTGGMVVQDVDLAAASAPRWMMYAPQAAAAGARAAFGFPVRIGAANFGALSLYRENPGHLSDAQTSDAYLMASVIARAVLSIQSGSPIGELAKELHGQSGLDFRVHQAAGMVAVQGSMSVKAALVLIRTHAFAEAMELSELAEKIITRATRFDSLLDSWIVKPTSGDPK